MYPRRLLQEAAFAANMLSRPPSTPPLVADPAPSSPADATPSSNIFYVNSRFSPTMIIIVVVLLSSFLFMALFAVYVRRCSGEEGSMSQHGDSRPRSRRDAERSGVDPLVVESYPIVSYAIAKKKGCCECTVCLGEFEKGDELKQLPKCKHLFHPGCIGLWLESHTTCPLCRRSLLNSDRWSVSFRWGDGSSRGALRRNGQESSRSCRSGEITSSRFGQADSTSTGWIGARSTVDDASCRGYPQSAEMSLQFMEAGAVDEHSDSRALPNDLCSSPHGLRANYDQLAYTHRVPASLPASEVALCGPSGSVSSNRVPQGTAQASSVPSALMPHEIEECCVATDVMPHEYQSSEVAARGEHANAILSELAASRSSELARGPRQAAAFPMSRSNSTGHLAGRRAVLQATRCMHRSRSDVGVDVVEKKEERMVGPLRQVFHGSTRP